MTINQVTNKVKENDPQADLILLQLAYEFAEKAHHGQRRATGEPYIQHSLHTAFLLAQMKADLTTIIAGLLHDVPEDTATKLEEIEKNFGSDVANLVKGITKLGKLKYRGVERYRENLRKMFLAMADDLRVILIKFCDRLHNLRSLEALPEDKKNRIAYETLEIYAPIAGLLGIWRLKWQMEDLCFKYLHPDEFKKILYKYEIIFIALTRKCNLKTIGLTKFWMSLLCASSFPLFRIATTPSASSIPFGNQNPAALKIILPCPSLMATAACTLLFSGQKIKPRNSRSEPMKCTKKLFTVLPPTGTISKKKATITAKKSSQRG
ncbi:MAG: HD domain-containing protein [Candidatus Falkowbacteria bacterium]|nr:HD domain-containing protein [Candidatus Falkowbacteria bacterium]